MTDGISAHDRAKFERVAERFVKKFDANENGQIDPAERKHEHFLPVGGSDPSFAIDGTMFVMHSTSTVKADLLDGKLVSEADANGDKAATPGELVDAFLKKHDTNGDGVTTKAELKADGAWHKRDFRQDLKSHTQTVETTRDNWQMGRFSGS
jgi:hypothetical protein